MIIKAKKAIIVARVSTEEQAKGKGQGSLPAQDFSVGNYVEKYEFDMIEEFPDIVESAFQGPRKKWKQILKDTESYYEKYNEPIAIIVDTWDRLTREWKLWVNGFDKLREEGKIEIHIAEEDFAFHQYSGPQDVDRVEGKIRDARSRSLRTSADVRRTLRLKLSRGEVPGYAPTGYLQPTKMTADGVVEKTLILDPIRAPLIKEVFELYATGNYSTAELAKITREKGLTMKPKKKRKPRPVARSDIREILNRLFYTGKFERLNPYTGKREIYEGNYEPIISEELYEKAQRVLEEKNTKCGMRYSSTKFFKFRGLVTCSFCGCVLTPNDLSKNYKNKKPGEEVYYRCTCSKKNINPNWYKKKFGTKNCPQRYWREKEIEEQIMETLEDITYDKKVFQQLRSDLNRGFETRLKLNEAEKTKLESEKKEKERLRDAFLDKMVLADGDVGFELDMKERVKAVRREIDIIEKKIGTFKQMENMQTDEFVDTLVLCSDLRRGYENLSDLKKRQLVILAFKEIAAKKGEVKVIKAGKPITMNVKGMFFAWREPFKTLEDIGFKKWLAEEGWKIGRGDLNKSKDSVPEPCP
jgi:DNA invertase Pin-like site-specific DNA recombinase